MDDSKNKIESVGGMDKEIASLPTKEQVSNFVQGNFEPGDVAEVRYIERTTRNTNSFWCIAGELPERVPQMQRLNGAGFDIYVGANPRRGFNFAGDTNVPLARCYFVDQDKGNGFTTIEALADDIAHAGLPEPTMLLASGHGGWAYWRLCEAAIDLRAWRAVQVGLAAKLQTDNKVVNPERICRLPGFWNLKEPKAWAWLHTIDTTRIYPASVFAHLAQVQPKPAAPTIQRQSGADSSALLMKRARVYVAAAEGAGEGGRNGACFRLAGHLAAFVGEGGEILTEGEIVDHLRGFNTRCTPPLADAELVLAVRSGMKNGQARELKPPRVNHRQIALRGREVTYVG